jgi:hypothetical protein
MQEIPQPKRETTSTTLAIGSRFKGYGPESEKESRKADIREKEEIVQLRRLWMEIDRFILYDPEKSYDHITSLLASLSYTKEDVQDFCIMLGELLEEDYFVRKPGLFLSALINNCEEMDHTIDIRHLIQPPLYLCYLNKKNVRIKGDVGRFFGARMAAGDVVIEGNAGGDFGDNMRGGTIIVNGDVGDEVGTFMTKGSITVKGNAGFRIGHWMAGGEIHLEGDYKGLSYVDNSGRIYHRGKLIFPK